MKLSALFIALLPLLGSPVIHAETTTAPVLENRAAQGDITTPGGARRLTGDQTEARDGADVTHDVFICFKVLLERRFPAFDDVRNADTKRN